MKAYIRQPEEIRLSLDLSTKEARFLRAYLDLTCEPLVTDIYNALTAELDKRGVDLSVDDDQINFYTTSSQKPIGSSVIYCPESREILDEGGA
jgi:hypothetical protein